MDASCNLISVIMFFSFFLGLSRFSFTVTVIDKLSSKLKIFLMIIIRCSCTRNFFLLTQKLTWLLTPRLCVGCCPLWGFMVCDFAVHELQVWGASSDTPWDTVPLCGCWWCPGNHSLFFYFFCFNKKETILLFLVSWRVVYVFWNTSHGRIFSELFWILKAKCLLRNRKWMPKLIISHRVV